MTSPHGTMRFGTTIRRAARLTMVGLGCLACGDDYIEVRGVIVLDQTNGLSLEVPDQFEVGVPATVTVATYFGGCARDGPTLVHVDGLLAVIEPYDEMLAPEAGRFCPSFLRSFPHSAQVEFRESGDATVRVIGIDHAGGDTLMTYDTTVVAR
jgi:hypothetical protein